MYGPMPSLASLRHSAAHVMAQNVQAVRFVNENRLNGVASRQLVGEINQHAVHACHNDLRVVSEQLSGSLRGDLALLSLSITA